MNNIASVAGRFGLSLIFILSGFAKLGAGYAGTQGYMEAMGVPGALLPLVILAEIGGGLAILFGLLTRTAAVSLAAFSLVSAFLFHFDLADQGQFINFMKNIAIAGGMLMLVASGAGKFSVDNWLVSRRNVGGAR
ncbi:MAG: DoxX family protein [Gammaproteobacteria bacterium RIFCSPHIGHO2_12_FULL_63_22]|nr:MAG: DoxX family protein [Gammaproteobacteria bacterium RIFCSPHIGHO2_12_FULL_63_22]